MEKLKLFVEKEKEFKVDTIDFGTVVKSGTGAVVTYKKKYLGRKVVIGLLEKEDPLTKNFTKKDFEKFSDSI